MVSKYEHGTQSLLFYKNQTLYNLVSMNSEMLPSSNQSTGNLEMFLL